jgi:hypothetical protein
VKLPVKFVLAAAVAALALPLAGASAASAASAAPAERTPVMYTQGMGPPWAGPARRPHSFVLGADFGISKVSWSAWTNSGASGKGRLLGCAGAQGPCVKYLAAITLRVVKVHHGTRYFATMKITGKRHKTLHLVMRGGLWTQT